MSDAEIPWRETNRANWNERAEVHLRPGGGYEMRDLRSGGATLDPIVTRELPPLAGKRVLHLQCHFGADTFRLLRLGAAEAVALDFSPTAIAAARALAVEFGLAERIRFVGADVYAAREAVPQPHDFDLVFVTWGAIPWLPDIQRWAEIVASMLRPGGTFFFAEGHTVAHVFDDQVARPDGLPGLFLPYFLDRAFVDDDPSDYADPNAQLSQTRTYQWMHPVGNVLSALIAAGLRLEYFHEHDAVTWRMFKCLVEGPDRLYRWPDKPWLPLSYSLQATRA